MIDGEQFGEVGIAHRQSMRVDIVSTRQNSNRRVNSANLASKSLDNPVDNANVFTKTGPQESAVVATAEPVDVEYFGSVP